MKHLAYIIACFVILFNAQIVNAQGDVKIGTQVWTSKNLDVSTFRNGDPIPEVKNAEEWRKSGYARQPAFCYYDFDSQNGRVYGKLYNWYAVNDPRGLAPAGYHVPSGKDWENLISFLGGGATACSKMKNKSGWNKNGSISGNGSNVYGLSILPSGYILDGNFGSIGQGVYMWGSSKHYDGYAHSFSLNVFGYLDVSSSPMNYGFSVRCLRENGDINLGSNSNNVSKVENISEKINNTILQNYSTVITIGNQVWTSKNLDVSTFRNGDTIPEAKNVFEWVAAGKENKAAFCYYNFDMKYGEKYGKLYNFYAVQDSRGLAPKGYHISTDAEWTVLTDFLGGDGIAGYKMKSKTGWYDSGNGDNSSLFNCLAGGGIDYNGHFERAGENGFWWSSTEVNSSSAWTRGLNDVDRAVYRSGVNRGEGYSVRCIRD